MSEARTVQFLVERACVTCPLFPAGFPPLPFPVWVLWPAEEASALSCPAEKCYRIVAGISAEYLGQVVCDQMGHLIE